MADICPICEGSGERLVERPGGPFVLESCECDAGRARVEARIQARRRRGMGGRRQQLLAQYESEEKIPMDHLQPGELLRWYLEDYGSFEAIPEEKKELLGRRPEIPAMNREAIIEMNAKLRPQPKRAQTRKAVPYVEGIAGMHGKVHGLD